MFMILPLLFWQIALDTMGLSWTTATLPEHTKPSEQDG